MKVYNTLTRKLETFAPINKNSVRFYACGPTVYNYQHIGNLRTYIFNDILKRVLLFNGYKVKHVMNVTDVGHLTGDGDEGDDKVLLALQREHLPISKESMLKLTKKYTTHFLRDCKKLNLLPADIVCKATEHVPEMIEVIKKIQKNGFAYETEPAVYFDVSQDKRYGELGRLQLEDLEAGARVKVDPYKKNPLDFVLWFKAVGKHAKHVMQWDAPFGRGFPGWHIECSAMSMHYLGEQFDIHTGGIDHIPVHHTNEIAQSEAATGIHPWVKYWMHGEFLIVGEEKMAKSKGTFVILDDLVEKGYDPLAYRYFCLLTHYRKQLAFTFEGFGAAQNALQKLRLKIQELLNYPLRGEKSAEKYMEDFQHAVNDDLNMPQAVATVWNMVKDETVNNMQKYKALLEFDRVLGLSLDTIKKVKVPPEIKELLTKREDARLHKHWAEADGLREEIQKKGYLVDDMPSGPLVKKA